MKKVIFGMLAVAGMFAATSCVNDTDLNCANGSEATVTFNVNVDQIAATRSISDGLQATQLYYEVYDENGTELVKRGETTVNNLTATVQVQLVSGVSYQAAFWAQNPDCKAYNAENLQNLTIDYSNAKNNDETMDAFFANTQFTVSGTSLSQSVTLQRPFAQINVGASSTPSDLGINASSVVVTGYYNSINLLNGNVGALQPGELEFASNTLPTETLSVDGGDYNYLSTTYLLATPSSELHKMVFSFTGTNEYTLTYDNTPVKRNYRTNILTDQSMDQFEFTITVEPAYGTPDNETLNGELEETDNLVTVSDVSATVSGDNVNFSAKYTGEVTEATFVCTPNTLASLRTRAEEGTVEVPATSFADGTITATASASQFTATSYTVSVKVNGNETATGSTTTLTGTGTTEPEQPSQPVTATFTMANFGTGITNGTAATSLTTDGITISFDKKSNSNAPAWYGTGTEIRLYGGGEMTVAGADGATVTITEIKITSKASKADNTWSANPAEGFSAATGTSSAISTWTGSSSSVVFTVGNTSGNQAITSVVVTYTK